MLDAGIIQIFIKHSCFPQDTNNWGEETDTYDYNYI